MIAEYRIIKASETFCCEDIHCEQYIKTNDQCVSFTEINDNGDVIYYTKCLSCAVDTIKDDIEERTVLLTKLESI